MWVRIKIYFILDIKEAFKPKSVKSEAKLIDNIKWRPPNLNKLTPNLFYIELSHLGLKASK